MKTEESAIIAMDLQERLLKTIVIREGLIKNIDKLITIANILDINIYSTEQNPAKLGSTIGLISSKLNLGPYPKTQFSCINCDKIIQSLKDSKIKTIVICGLESHICILQSSIDLINMGFEVFIPIDCIGSRNLIDHKVAIKRLEREGAILATMESIAFEWCRTSNRPEFKEISKVIKS